MSPSPSLNAQPTAPPRLEDLTHTFIISSTSGNGNVSGTALQEVPSAVDPSRRRRPHHKSRTGCTNCKRRRVKCTGIPERCNRPTRASTSAVAQTQPVMALGGSPGPHKVNLLDLKLFHHFINQTRHTLPLVGPVWDKEVLHLSTEFDFLANALLCVSARHLSMLLPEDPFYSHAAGMYLSNALSGLQTTMERMYDVSSQALEAILATSFLLQVEIWASPNFYGTRSVKPDMSGDQIFSFTSSLKSLLINGRGVAPETVANSPLLAACRMLGDPSALLESAVGGMALRKAREKYQPLFEYNTPQLNPSPNTSPLVASTDTLTKRTPSPEEVTGYTQAVDRLCLILSFLPSSPHSPSPHSNTNTNINMDSVLLHNIARFIFSFPVQCFGPFASMVKRSDAHSFLVMYHFYQAAGKLLPKEKYWWATRRVKAAEDALGELVGEGTARES